MYSMFISLVIEYSFYNRLEHLNHSHVAVALYHIMKISSYYAVLYNKAVMYSICLLLALYYGCPSPNAQHLKNYWA